MARRKKTPNQTERAILKSLVEHDYYLTTTQVAKRADVSWNTAYKYLDKFHKKGWINMRKRGNRKLWKALPPQ